MMRTLYRYLSSVKLAMALLVVILASCVVGVTIFRGEKAWNLIFSTLWFNGLLVALVVNVACCFFPRMWGRKLTLVSAGMILFHLSFVAILGGIAYNSLFYFRGLIRLTEGEVLSSGSPESYDQADIGRFFRFGSLKGETTLVKMHRDYLVDGKDKRAAYEIAVGEPDAKTQGIIYITKSLDHKGFSYFNEKEGYSVLIMLYDSLGRELYGAFVPLQSLRQEDGGYLYTTGTRHGPGSFPYPQDPMSPFFSLQVAYIPSKFAERAGEAVFQVWPYAEQGQKQGERPIAEGKTVIGEKIRAGEYYLSVTEIRYWVGMTVRHEPGKPFVLTSLWIGFGGMVITFIGRLRRGRGAPGS